MNPLLFPFIGMMIAWLLMVYAWWSAQSSNKRLLELNDELLDFSKDLMTNLSRLRLKLMLHRKDHDE